MEGMQPSADMDTNMPQTYDNEEFCETDAAPGAAAAPEVQTEQQHVPVQGSPEAVRALLDANAVLRKRVAAFKRVLELTDSAAGASPHRNNNRARSSPGRARQYAHRPEQQSPRHYANAHEQYHHNTQSIIRPEGSLTSVSALTKHEAMFSLKQQHMTLSAPALAQKLRIAESKHVRMARANENLRAQVSHVLYPWLVDAVKCRH
jgi:hypothetical protein